MFDDWWCSFKIDEKTKKFFKCNNGLPPKFYELIKIHKKDHNVRPVTSFLNYPLCNISKYLGSILNNITSTSNI